MLYSRILHSTQCTLMLTPCRLQTAAEKPLHVARTQPKLNYMLKSRQYLSSVADAAAQPPVSPPAWRPSMVAVPASSLWMMLAARGEPLNGRPRPALVVQSLQLPAAAAAQRVELGACHPCMLAEAAA